MTVMMCAVSALAVALLHSTWREHHAKLVGQQQQLRERVTYMLWVMANKAPELE